MPKKRSKAEKKPTKVVMLTSMQSFTTGYRKGETHVFPLYEAQSLIEKGFARAHTPDDNAIDEVIQTADKDRAKLARKTRARKNG